MSKPVEAFAREKWLDSLLLLSGSFIIFWALGDRGLWAAEGRWAQITREMFLTGDFFHPMIGGSPYFDKPLLTYWLIAAVSLVTGTLNEWVVRLPSAIAGIAAIWATKNLGARLWSPKVGRTAAWILLTSYGFLFWSRTGTAEAENVAAIIIAVAWYWARRDRPGFVTFLVFYLIIFAGALTKGLTAVIIPVLAVLCDLVGSNRWRALLKPAHFLALAPALALYLSPFVYAAMTRPETYQADGLSLVFRENFVRYFDAFDHKGPVYTYIYSIPALLFPWAPLWIAALAGTSRFYKHLDDRTRWLLKIVGCIFVFFTISGSRRSYYILPILPFCALLTAVFAIHLNDERFKPYLRWGVGAQSALLFGMVLMEVIAPLGMLIIKPDLGFDLPPQIYAATLVIGAVALTLNLTADRRLRRGRRGGEAAVSVMPSIVMAALAVGGYFCWQQVILGRWRTERPFVRQLQAKTASMSPRSIGVFKRNCPTLQFYLETDHPVQLLESREQLNQFLAEEPAGVLITQRKYVGEISEVAPHLAADGDMCEPVRAWDSDSSRKAKWVAWMLDKTIAKTETYPE